MYLKSIGLYIHTPFCSGKCFYCDFYSLKSQDYSLYGQYKDALYRHMRAMAPKLSGIRADTVYFGGGTPTVTGAKQLSELLSNVRECFAVDTDAEITVEANPGDLCVLPGDGQSERALALLRQAGFNRISFGVQSCHDEELSALGRRHTFGVAQVAVRQARAAGFENITLDLMYGLPRQTMTGWRESVERVLELEPEHLSCYALKLSKQSPLYPLSDQLPDDDAQLTMYLWMVERLSEAGMNQYEISNFAKPGFRSRHNRKYWDLSEYLGFGPSAHSLLEGERFAFSPDVEEYIRGSPDPVKTERSCCDSSNSLQEYLMLRLRTTDGLDKRELAQRYSISIEVFENQLIKYEKAGLCRHTDGRWSLTPRGFFVSNAIIVELWRVADGLSHTR